MADSTEFGDRMKRYEAAAFGLLPRRTYTIIRVDGKSFHTYLKDDEKPFDMDFIEAMQKTAAAMCREMAGTVFAYGQSDEISFLLTDFATNQTQPWFGGEIQKMVSISASLATAHFNDWRRCVDPELAKSATFDSRAFTIPDPVEVGNYFIWRQRDAVRNSVSMAAQAKFSHKELRNINSGGMQEMLFREHGINWNEYPDECKRGWVVTRETSIAVVNDGDEPIRRHYWRPAGAPHFMIEADNFLARRIPVIPPMPVS